MGSCSSSSSNNINPNTLEFLNNKVYEVRYLKILGEEPFDWKFDCFWKKRLKEHLPKNPKDKTTIYNLIDFSSSFPEMKKHRNQKIIKDTKIWPYVCMGIVKSFYKLEEEDLEYFKFNSKQKISDNSFSSNNEENFKEKIGMGILIGNSIVLTLVKNIYLIINQKGNFESKIKEIKAEEVKFYISFNGNNGYECEIDSIHHLGYENISEISNDIALLFLKKPVGEDYGFLGVSDDLDHPKYETVEITGYLFDDFYENKLFLNEMKMQIIKEEKNNKIDYQRYQEAENQEVIQELENPEIFIFENNQGLNMLPGAAIWNNKSNKHSLMGLYLGKNEKNQHYGRYLSSNIFNIKEWILDYWFENKKENKKILMGGEDFKIIKNEALQGVIEKFKNLNNVNLNNSNLLDQDVLLIVQNLNLNVLKIRNNNLTTDTAIYIANNQRNIEELDLSYNIIGYVGIKEIASKLKKIKIFLLEKVGLKDNSLMDISVNLIDLAVLDITRNFITDKGIEQISNGNINLSELYIGYNEQITDKGIDFISESMNKLIVLGLNDTLISDESLSFISSRLIFMKKINLYRCNITDVGVNELVENLKKLENLNLTQCNGVSEDLKNYLIKNKTIKNIII